MSLDTDRIRALNDELRQHLLGGNAVMTSGIAALGSDAVRRLVRTISVFDDFCHANDPHERHDFGMFDFEGAQVIFKIDYYDEDMRFGSEDPSDLKRTTRVLTLMLASEY